MGASLRLGVIILAAGAGRRFGGAKQLALLDGRALLQHVVDAVVAAEPAAAVAVLGHEADAVEAAIDWQGVACVRNPDAHRGLASSLRVGLAAAAAIPDGLDGVFVVLGDQPRLRPGTLRSLAAAAAGSDRPIVVPAWTDEPTGSVNPALLRRAVWPLAEALDGDRGMGPLIASRPDLVERVPMAGANPDIDTPDDLARI